jgi:hypothetical protein
LVELVVPFNTPSYVGIKNLSMFWHRIIHFLHKCSKCTYTYIRQLLLVARTGHVHKWSTRNTFDMNMCLKEGSIHSCNPMMRGGGMHPRGPKFCIFFFWGWWGLLDFCCSHQVLNIFLMVPRLIPFSLP